MAAVKRVETLFSLVTKDRSLAMGLDYLKVYQMSEKRFLTVRTIGQWNALPRNTVASLSREIIKKRLGSNHTETV